MQHDFYRPAGWHYLKGGVDQAGKLVAWRNHFVSFGEGERFATAANISATEFPGRFVANYALDASVMPLGVPTGGVRAPGAMASRSQRRHSSMSWRSRPGKIRCSSASISSLTHRSSIPLRQPHRVKDGLVLFDGARMRRVVELVAEKSGWGKPKLPRGTGMGVAFHFSHRGYFAEVVQVTVRQSGTVKIDKVWVAGDVGSEIINPSNAENQVHGSVLDGIAEALTQEITIERGARSKPTLATSACCACVKRLRSKCIGRSTSHQPVSVNRRFRRSCRRYAARSSLPPGNAFVRSRSRKPVSPG